MRIGIFPKTREKPLFIWRDGSHFVALAEKKEFIKLYIWDGVAISWNESIIFEKVSLKLDLSVKNSKEKK